MGSGLELTGGERGKGIGRGRSVRRALQGLATARGARVSRLFPLASHRASHTAPLHSSLQPRHGAWPLPVCPSVRPPRETQRADPGETGERGRCCGAGTLHGLYPAAEQLNPAPAFGFLRSKPWITDDSCSWTSILYVFLTPF